MKKTNLVLFPVLAALLLAGCTSTPKKKKKTSSGAETSQKSGTSAKTTSQGGGGGGTSNPTSQGGQTSTTPTPSGDSTFNLTPGSGQHTVSVDFASIKKSFPYVDASTGLYEVDFAGLSSNGVGCYVSTYNSASFLMMKNKDDFYTNHGAAFIANKVSLGSISEISFTPGSSASANAVYNVAILDAAVTAEGGSTAGQSFTGSGGKVTGSGAYFCITCTSDKYNGQLGTLTITYTIQLISITKTREELVSSLFYIKNQIRLTIYRIKALFVLQ